MSHPESGKLGPETLLAAWIKSATDFTESLAGMWPSFLEEAALAEAGPEGLSGPSPEMWLGNLMRLWESWFAVLGGVAGEGAAVPGSAIHPDILLKTAQTWWEAYNFLHRQWLAQTGKLGPDPQMDEYAGLDQETAKTWLAVYEAEFQQLLSLCGGGWTRLPQARLDGLTDKFKLFQESMADFIYLLHLPIEQSLQEMPEKMPKRGGGREPAGDFKDYYKRWIKLLEGYFLMLFQSKEYLSILNYALQSLADYWRARDEALREALSALPIAGRQEMDEVYQELYLLKKQVRELGKRLEKLERKSGVRD